MRRFSAHFGWPRGCEPDMGYCPLCSVATKKPQHRQVFQDRVNSWVHYSFSGPYGIPRRLYGSKILEPSRTTRFPLSKTNGIHFTASSERVFEAKSRSTLGRLLCTKTTDVSAKEFKEGRKQEKKIMSEKMAGKEKEEKEGKEKEEKEEETKEGGKEEEEEKKETEKEEKKVEKKEVAEEKEDKEQEGQEEGDEDKGEKERWWLLQKSDSHDYKKKRISGSHVQGTAPRTVTATAEMISIWQTYRPQEGNQPCQDLSNYKDVNTLVCSRKNPRSLSCSSSHGHARDNRQDGEDAPRCPQPDSAHCATLQETSLKEEVELTSLLVFTPSQEPQKEKLGKKPQATVLRSPATPTPALQKTRKRKGAVLKLYLPPSRPPPTPWLLQLLCNRRNLPPPPKIPRTDAQRESSSVKNEKHQTVQISDEVDVLQPNTQVVATGIAPQPVLPRLPSDSVPAVSRIPSPGHLASASSLCQAARPPTPSVPSPSFSPSIPTIPISLSALPSDSLSSCQARPCVETPPDVKKKGPTDLAAALAPAISHLPRPGAEALSFNPPSCRRESAESTCIASDPSLPFSAAPPSPHLGKPPTASSTTASQSYEEMCWEPYPLPAEVDMDTTPAIEATILRSPTVSSVAAPTPSQAVTDVEEMDTTPPSKAVILHSSPGANGASNSLPHPSMWTPTTTCHRTGVQSTRPLSNELQSNDCAFTKKPSPATVVVDLSSQSASGSKTQPRFAGSASPADPGRPSSPRKANAKRRYVSFGGTMVHSLKTEAGPSHCSSPSANVTPSTSSASVAPSTSSANVAPSMPSANVTPRTRTPSASATPSTSFASVTPRAPFDNATPSTSFASVTPRAPFDNATPSTSFNNSAPSTSTSLRPVASVSGENRSFGVIMQRSVAGPSSPSTGRTRNGTTGPDEPVYFALSCSSKHSNPPVKRRTRRR